MTQGSAQGGVDLQPGLTCRGFAPIQLPRCQHTARLPCHLCEVLLPQMPFRLRPVTDSPHSHLAGLSQFPQEGLKPFGIWDAQRPGRVVSKAEVSSG
jgi:hypothetical protein